MIVVSDTSPVLNLARIGRLDLLERLYGQVLMPSAVLQELRLVASGLDATFDIDALPWFIVADASDRRRVDELRTNLDSGEAEAIALAIEHRADLLLIDEKLGRRIASAEGLTVTGLLGVIAHAKRVGAITEAKPVLDDLIRIARFWIGPALYKEVLTHLDERP